MDYKIFTGNAVGYKNIIRNLNSQDNLNYKIGREYIICCVADGHSSEFFEYSNIGSELACKSAIEVINEEINTNKDRLILMLENENIQKRIYEKWMGMVREDYFKNHLRVYRTQYIKYSTTLIVVAITKKWKLYLKIGDGDIIVNKDGNFKKIIKTKNNKIVDSLGREDSFKNIMYCIEDLNDNDTDNIILFTDGYENSFLNEDELYKNLETTIYKYNSNIFSRMKLIATYNSYLSRLSKETSKDDISIIFLIK